MELFYLTARFCLSQLPIICSRQTAKLAKLRVTLEKRFNTSSCDMRGDRPCRLALNLQHCRCLRTADKYTHMYTQLTSSHSRSRLCADTAQQPGLKQTHFGEPQTCMQSHMGMALSQSLSQNHRVYFSSSLFDTLDLRQTS